MVYSKALVMCFAGLLTAPAFAQPKVEQDAPPLVTQINNGNWFKQEEAQALVDELYYQNAVHAYITMLPALNMLGIRDGSEKEFGSGYHKGGPDPAPAVALAETTRVYPLYASEKDVKPMQFPNGSGKKINMMYPTDNAYWTKLKAFVDYEPVAAIDPELRGVLASIGIIKGKPFEPTAKQQELLKKAVEIAPKMILAYRQLGRPDERDRYYKDRQYLNAWGSGTAEWMQESYTDPIQRATYMQVAYASASAMVIRSIGAGSKYPFTFRDADGDFLDGSKTYKLHLPKDPPAALFWAVTAYNVTDGTMTETPQLLPSINGMNTFQSNADGSVDLYFGPTKPAAAGDGNWIQTVNGRAFLVALRLYGAGTEFYDQTWKPDDVVKVK